MLIKKNIVWEALGFHLNVFALTNEFITNVTSRRQDWLVIVVTPTETSRKPKMVSPEGVHHSPVPER